MSKQTEALELAMDLALDVRANANVRLAAKAIALTGVIDEALAEQPAQQYNATSDPQLMEMPKIGCVNHDCDKCKAQQQEPVLWLVNGVVQSSDIPADYTGCLFTSPQPAQQQEPVACAAPMACSGADKCVFRTSPQPSKPLTDEQWQVMADTLHCVITRTQKDIIEAALGIKGDA